MDPGFAPQSAVPELQTDRLTLRAHGLGDYDAVAAMWSDPDVTRHITGRPSTPAESWNRLLRYAGHWRLLGFGYWVLEDRDTGTFCGEAGFADYHRAVEPPLDGIPEIGWVLASHAHGRGLATEAVRSIVAWGDAHFGPVRTACLLSPDNPASIRVAEKCGYTEWTRTTYSGEPTLLYHRLPGPG